ncbi:MULTISPECIES: hypothetical protein [unclassified Caulobacter]|uniref:hypothetical protein n=1 Tax=unclassified Caulobacter TaxID=2648921 RepID=UPI000D379F17|nr:MULTISPECIES: hypothetical protein [unclassified Caulobacter]PTS89482.1 hypothetical protein DBR21_06400 [Caulobacter sp. HMWF009]PTT06032.1 hypothetical protein DBR10_13825 [Caulobacter sp. HMWF025]
MHRFTELADRAASLALNALNEAETETIEALQTNGATVHVKNLQMIRLSKAIFAVGMFSVFEAMLQDSLDKSGGFEEARKLLRSVGEADLERRFHDYQLAINALKHGEGGSYKKLLARRDALPFKVFSRDDENEFEGDVSAISTLVDVDDAFVEACGGLIHEVSEVIARVKPDVWL